ncbi:hypothetical protein B0H19DRAFT_492965 [Mycena capillaripes]|nr:hypothetical protein B0H19DRAFT_492965 [Mycena capillaripes]
MRANSFCAAVFCCFFGCLVRTNGLLISTPPFLTAGPARINFTKTDGDPAGAFFNIAVPANASRLADNVDLSLGFVDVDIIVLPGTYSIFAFGNDSDGGFLGSTDHFSIISSIVPQAPPTSSLPSSTSSPVSSPPASSLSQTSAVSHTGSGTEAPASTASSPTTKTSSKPAPIGMIIGIVVAVLAIIAVLVFLFFFLRRRRQRARRLSPGIMAETPGAMFHPSLSVTSRSYPTGSSTQPDPFITPPSSNTSLASPQQRQQHITNEMRLVRKQMEELRRTGNGASMSSHSAESSALSPTSAASTHDSDLERSRQQNDALQSRIVQLEAQLQSAWALGLSNEPPPGYVA